MPAKKRNPGEYKRQSLITVEMDAFQASLFAPEKLKELERTTPGVLAQARDDVIEEQYIVTTRRIQGTWEYEVTHVVGDKMRMPAGVIDRFMDQRKAIIKEGRSDTAKARAAPKSRAGTGDPQPTAADVARFLGAGEV